MTQSDPSPLAQELQQLKQQLATRDQLVDQLSAELFRVIQSNPPLLAPAAESLQAALPNHGLAQELEAMGEQIEFYQQQIDDRDNQISHLQASCQSLSDRNQQLEKLIQELPEVYKSKFSDRLDQVKHKMQSLQTENQRLYSQLQQSETGEPGSGSRRLLPSFRNKAP
jgi:chromosome segregation ATPase